MKNVSLVLLEQLERSFLDSVLGVREAFKVKVLNLGTIIEQSNNKGESINSRLKTVKCIILLA